MMFKPWMNQYLKRGQIKIAKSLRCGEFFCDNTDL